MVLGSGQRQGLAVARRHTSRRMGCRMSSRLRRGLSPRHRIRHYRLIHLKSGVQSWLILIRIRTGDDLVG